MRLRKEDEEKTLVMIKNTKTKKSKTYTVYDCSMEEMIKHFEKVLSDNAT